MTRPTKVRYVASIVLLAGCVALNSAFSRWADMLFPTYRTFSKALAAAQANLASVAPCALWDVMAAALVVAAVVALVRRIRGRRPLSPWLSWVCLVCSVAAFLFVGWALNHYAPSLASEIGLEVGEYTVDELADATEYYLGRAAALASQVPREADGSGAYSGEADATNGSELPRSFLPSGGDGKNSVAVFPTSLAEQDFYELARIAGASYEGLAGDYPIFEGSTAPVKALLLWGYPLLYSGHTGIYWAPTGESGVPLDCARAEMPFTMCHEAAHRLGIASEQEANFAAFLACQASNDVRLRYSGYYEAFAYCYNALCQADPDRAQRVLQDVASGEGEEVSPGATGGAGLVSDTGANGIGVVSAGSEAASAGVSSADAATTTDEADATGQEGAGVALVLQDRADTSEHYRQFAGPLEQVGTTVNDTYLKSFGETSGVRSYGQVVDYLIAWYEQGGA